MKTTIKQKLTNLMILLSLMMPMSITSAFAADAVSGDLNVYKSPSCGCCGKWVEHLNNEGIQTSVHNSDSLAEIKLELGIAAPLQSCHTAVSKAGYVALADKSTRATGVNVW